ncbi:MAG: cytochrome c-type biogenesis protein CcmH [Proteobacteria bacterium]|nr:cytochrome c-type biogenesis protein CcmH [Pseudomonadota bacterium]
MYSLILKFILYMSFAYSLSVIAAPVETFKFDSPETEKSFHKLSDELRCLVCQNQNIAESNAGLAKDLRLEIYTMLSQGKTEDEIVDFMVQRYGDYVLYRPPFKPMTWLLWFGPIIIFIIGLFYAIRFLKSQNTGSQADDLSDEDIERIKSLHSEQNRNKQDSK